MSDLKLFSTKVPTEYQQSLAKLLRVLMMTQMSIAEINLLYSQAIEAVGAGDYDTAINKALAAQFRLSSTPNIMRIIAAGQEQITWSNVGEIDKFIANCRKQKGASLASSVGPFQQMKVIYTRPDSYNDDCYR